MNNIEFSIFMIVTVVKIVADVVRWELLNF